jgi:hypothetical protein
MNTPITGRQYGRKMSAIVACLILGIATSEVYGQPAQAGGRQESPKSPEYRTNEVNVSQTENEEIVKMNPFVVSVAENAGYAATSTLAGTRLNTPVKDLGAALSIYTQEFMKDLNATSVADLLVYAVDAEVGGVNGNYSGTGESTAYNSADNLRMYPERTQRIRGLVSASLTRNYFLTDVPFDAYNSSQITVSRGANAILYGMGSPSGIIDNGLDQPEYANRGKISLRASSEGGSRTTLDVNRVLIPRKLAFRLESVYDDDRYQQKPAFQQSRRIYGAILWEPSRNTSIRGSAEIGRIHANRPNPDLALDQITLWINAGHPLVDFAAADRDPKVISTSVVPTVDAGQPFNVASTLYAAYSDPSSSTISFVGRNTIPSAEQKTTNSKINVDGQAETYLFYKSQNYSAFATNSRDQGFTPANAAVFDWENQMLESDAYQNSAFHAYNIAVAQRGWGDRVGLELSGNAETYGLIAYDPLGNQAGQRVYVDVNTTLSDGSANPNVGRPFLYTGAVNQIKLRTERGAFRATGFLAGDFADLNKTWGKWLGSHRLTVLYDRQRVKTLSAAEKLSLAGPAQISLFGTTLRDGGHQMNRIIYIGPSLLNTGSTADVRLEPVTIPIWTPGLQVPVTYWDSASQSFKSDVETAEAALNTGTVSKEIDEAKAAVLQSHWLEGNLVTLVGWRRDQATLYTNSTPSSVTGADGFVRYVYDGFEPPSTPSYVVKGSDIWTYSAVLRAPGKIAARIPGVTDLGVFFNDSQNFSTSAGRINEFGQSISPPHGKTREYGLQFSVWGNRLNVRVNRFETSSVGTTSNGVLGSAVANVPLTMLQTWIQDRNLGINRESEIALLQNAFPAAVLQTFSVTSSQDSTGKWTASYRNPSGLSDTTDLVSKGVELEMTYNVENKWRFLLNVAKIDVEKSNINPWTEQWINYFQPTIDALANAPYGSALGVNRSNPSSYTTVANNWAKSVTVPYASIKAQQGNSNLEVRPWRVNLVADYQFSRGMFLKGWDIGTGVRWQDRGILGYVLVQAPDGSYQVADRDHPRQSPAQWNVDAWLRYTRRLAKGRTWEIQLNVKNLYRNRGIQPLAIQAMTGDTAQYMIPNSTVWYLTNSLTF